MPKSTDIKTPELKEFNKIFDRLAYRHQYDTVFHDFLDLFIKQLSHDDCEELNQRIQRVYDQKERLIFGELIVEGLQVYKKMVNHDKAWFDLFGEYYEVLVSRGKSSALGQFFTPPHICDLMTQLQGEYTGKRILVNDPTCGSGRMLLSFHVNNLGNYHIANDLDVICCKMTVLNMFLHGICGIVVNQDTLAMDFRRAWVVNEHMYTEGRLSGIMEINEKQVNTLYQYWDIIRKAYNPQQETEPVIEEHSLFEHDPEKIEVINVQNKEVEQLKLF